MCNGEVPLKFPFQRLPPHPPPVFPLGIVHVVSVLLLQAQRGLVVGVVGVVLVDI